MNIYHTCEDRTPYTYLIGWSHLNKWYYGRRTAKGCHPSELWVKYFTSSKSVKPRFHEFKYHILAEFFDKNDAYNFEAMLILENWKNEKLLNKCVFGKNFANGSKKGIPKSEEHKKAMSKARMGVKRLSTTVQKMREATLKQHKIKVCRCFDKKEMDIGNFTKWLSGVQYSFNESTKLEIKNRAIDRWKTGMFVPLVCRIRDKKIMTYSNFVRWP
jgi:hypothetical protein